MLNPPDPNSLRIVPLGGLGEIGQNCLVIEHTDGLLVVDCGTSFPTDDMGIDVWHPDFTWLETQRSRILGVFLTHGHEDHIGALPYLLRSTDVPVWGPRHALELAKRRLFEHGFGRDDVDFRPAAPGRSHGIGPFEIEPIVVSHSIVEATALCIRSDAGVVVHSGDFNFDATLPTGERTDVARLSELGDAGVDLLLSDSTNVDIDEREGCERSVAEDLERLVEGADQRVFVSLFASNVHRLKALGNIALRRGRAICVLGRSLQMHVEVATELGKLDWPSHLLVSPEQAADWPRNQLLVLAGGTQAEHNSALCRIAAGDHRFVKVDPGDLVVLSSRIIPGHERSVQRMRCDLLRRGARVVARETDPFVHTSGHAGRSEQLRMLELVRPKSFLPVHGTLHHLLEHAELAKTAGVEHVLVVENGTAVSFDGGRLIRSGAVPNGKVAVALGGKPISAVGLAERSELGRFGTCHVTVVVSPDGTPAAEPRVTLRGIAGSPEDAFVEKLGAVARAAARRFRARPGDTLENAVRRAVGRELVGWCGRRPVIGVHVVEL